MNEGRGQTGAAEPRRFSQSPVRPRILIVGCGAVGLKVARLLNSRCEVFALVRDPDRAAALREAGTTPVFADLDEPASLARAGLLASHVIHLVPPPLSGTDDPRTRHLTGALRGVRRMVYISTTGVYGDCQGARFDETRTPQPTTARAQRRVAAERWLRTWARAARCGLSIVRVPGIYDGARLPLERLRAGTPALTPSEDVYTNHIHSDDLARIIVAALWRGAPQRVYHAVDDSELLMGDFFDRVADHHQLPRPPRLPRSALERAVSPALYSFMSESRRLDNTRLKVELGVRLAYPTVTLSS